MIKQIGLGGGCHWCTEAVFASLKGVAKVEQGWIASLPPHDAFSEAVIVHYNTALISLRHLTEIHLYTHAATSKHSLRYKYRSALYWFCEEDKQEALTLVASLQSAFDKPLITQVLPFCSFQSSLPMHLNYYLSNPEKPFCKRYIHPKLQLLRQRFARHLPGESE